MSRSNPVLESLARRRLLSWLAASPLIAASATTAGTLASLLSHRAHAQSYDVLRAAKGPANDGVITDASQALDVFDFEPAAKKALAAAPAHYGYLASGVDDDSTLRANRYAFRDYSVRVRRLIDARKIDTRVQVFGETWTNPIFLCPVSSMAAFNPESREIGVAQAAGKRGQQMILSTVGNSTVAELNKAHGSPIWFMLYPTNDFNVTKSLVKRAEDSGAPVTVLTVDRQGGRNTETLFRMRFDDTRPCTVCHVPGAFANEVRRKPMFDGFDLSHVTDLYGTGMTWQFVDRLREIVRGKLVLKGIMTGEDASEALRHGVDGIIVSNHGGRAEASGQSTLGVLPEVVHAVNGRVPVMLDGGVRRGSDVFKALALGATAVGIGRPYCWGNAAFGEAGVDRVLAILQDEFSTIMRQAGTLSLAQIDVKSVNHATGTFRDTLTNDVPGRRDDFSD
jgi:isopentenyl diphosphate isomerase/L-lactate dehydrogenase-like FMN-dependent dehydrogenase